MAGNSKPKLLDEGTTPVQINASQRGKGDARSFKALER
jgi:hypothetical protein